MKDKSIGIIGGTGNHGFGIAKKLAKNGYTVVIGSRSQEKGETKANELRNFLNEADNINIKGGNNAFAAESDIIILSIPFKGSEELLAPIKENFKQKILVDVMVNLKFDLLNKEESTYSNLKIRYPESKIVSCLKTVATSLLNNQESINQTDFVVAEDDEAAAVGLKISTLMGLQSLLIKNPIHATTIENLVVLAIHLNKTYKGSHAGFLVTDVKN